MPYRRAGGIRGAGFGPVDPGQITDPLEVILQTHHWQRAICVEIERLVQAPALTQADCQPVLEFLTTAFTDHIADEEEDLFPLMRKRCPPQDEIESTLDAVRLDHRVSRGFLPTIVKALERVQEVNASFTRLEKQLLSQFVVHERRHLILVNAIVLPLARVRLSEADKRKIHAHMCARRGLAGGTAGGGPVRGMP